MISRSDKLLACLILRAYLKTTYRGVLELLAVSPNLREELGMRDKLPHSPRCRNSARGAKCWR